MELSDKSLKKQTTAFFKECEKTEESILQKHIFKQPINIWKDVQDNYSAKYGN